VGGVAASLLSCRFSFFLSTLLSLTRGFSCLDVAGAAIVVVVATKKTAVPIQSFKRLIGHWKIIAFQGLKFGTSFTEQGS